MSNQPRLTEKSLEDLCIAVIQLESEDGQLQCFPKDVLQPWILEQIPAHSAVWLKGKLL